MDFRFDDADEALHRRMLDVGAACARLAPGDRLDHLAKSGALGLAVARDHGGGGHSLVATARAYEALGASLDDGGVLLAAGAHLFGVALVLQKLGTEAQKRLLLPALASGEAIATVAATETESGSDVASVRALVTRSSEGFTLSGTKCFVTSAARAEVFLAVARGPGEKGVSTVLASRSRGGVASGAPLDTAGLENAGLAPVTFDAAPVELLGKPGAGLAVFQAAMTFERAMILAFRLGAMERALADTVRFARGRRAGATPIAKHQAVAHRLARMKLRLEASRLLVYRAAWALDQGERAHAEAALAKWSLAEAAIESALDDFRLRGGGGFMIASKMPAHVIDALGGSVHSGTGDVLAGIVAGWLGV